MAKEKTAEKTMDLGCIYDFIPMIQEKLGGMCPREDVLREILNAYTTGLMKSINTALRFRYVEAARKFNPLLPTAQECYDFAKTAEEDPGSESSQAVSEEGESESGDESSTSEVKTGESSESGSSQEEDDSLQTEQSSAGKTDGADQVRTQSADEVPAEGE